MNEKDRERLSVAVESSVASELSLASEQLDVLEAFDKRDLHSYARLASPTVPP